MKVRDLIAKLIECDMDSNVVFDSWSEVNGLDENWRDKEVTLKFSKALIREDEAEKQKDEAIEEAVAEALDNYKDSLEAA